MYNIKKDNNMENTETFVKAILDGDNVKASKQLEQIMKKKVAKRLVDVLKA